MTVARWTALVDALLAGRLDAGTVQLLCSALLSADKSTEWEQQDRPDGLPSGTPAKRDVRRAAARLLELPMDPTDQHSVRVRCLALMRAVFNPQDAATVDGVREPRARLARCREAVELAIGGRDEDLIVYTLSTALFAASTARDWDAGAACIEQMLGRLKAPQRDAALAGVSLFEDLTGATWYDARWVWRLKLRYLFWQRVRTFSENSGTRRWDSDIRPELQACSDELASIHPLYRSKFAAIEGVDARRLGDRDGFRAAEARLLELCTAHPDSTSADLYLVCRQMNAQLLNDYRRKLESSTARAGLALRGFQSIDDLTRTCTAQEAHDSVGTLRASGAVESLRRLGNGAYEAGGAIVLAGRTTQSEAEWEEASQWINVAGEAWRDFGLNGLRAVEFSRVRLLLRAPGGPRVSREEATDRLLVVVEEASRAGLRRNALRLAVTTAEAGDARVEALLDRELDRATVSGLGHTLAIATEFTARRALASGDDPAAIAQWRQVELLAVRSASGLRAGNHFRDPRRTADMLKLAADAIARQPGADSPNTATDRLDHLLEAIHCLALSLLNLSTEEDRIQARRDYAPLFVDAAETAITLGDTAAADQIMETLRRERVGVLLADLATDERVSDLVRAAAERIQTAAAATIQHAGSEDGPLARELVIRDHDALAQLQEQATRDAESILGPLATLSRVSHLRQNTSEAVFAAKRARTGTVIVLLQLAFLGVDDPARPARLLRKVSWCDVAGRMHDVVDIADVDRALLGGNPNDAGYFTALPALATALLPPALIELLLAAERPVRMLVIPTGVHTVPFDALPLNETEQLIDRAIVTVHTSITAMLALLDVERKPSHRKSTIVYDAVGLQHAERERRALLDALRRVDHDVRTIPELGQALRDPSGYPGGLLAMAVHGSSSRNGWGQIKNMPDGTVLRPTDVLAWDVPRLCVLASCHSSITSSDGVDLSGFPLAMFLRGATTVIGSLFAVPDSATSDIMSTFWQQLGEDRTAAEALRTAKLNWIADHPNRRGRTRDWSGLVVYGGAHH